MWKICKIMLTQVQTYIVKRLTSQQSIAANRNWKPKSNCWKITFAFSKAIVVVVVDLTHTFVIIVITECFTELNHCLFAVFWYFYCYYRILCAYLAGETRACCWLIVLALWTSKLGKCWAWISSECWVLSFAFVIIVNAMGERGCCNGNSSTQLSSAGAGTE